MRPLQHVIIGNSAAAIGAVEAIRAQSPADLITLFSAEPEHCYSRPLISELLAGEVTVEAMGYRPANFYERLGVTARLGTPIAAIDLEMRGVVPAGGELTPYDRLLIATGSVPFRPPIEDEGEGGLYTFNSAADALALLEAAAAAKRVVVIGGGLIGMKAAESLRHRGLEVTVVELAPHILSSAFDAAASRLFAAGAEAAGVRLVTDNAVTAIRRKGGWVRSVVLADNEELAADLVVMAVGVRPNVELAKAAGLAVDRGIVVDEEMRTSAPDVFAAGDCAQGVELISGQRRVMPLWPVAHRQGRAAGSAMAGKAEPAPPGLPMNSITLFGVSAMSAGQLAPEPGDLELVEAAPGSYRKVILREDRLVGAVAVGAVDRFGILTGLIVDQRPCSFLREAFPKQPVSLLNLPAEYRQEKLRR